MRWLIEICCCVLMFSDVAGVSHGGASFVKKCAYIGQAAKLLSNIDNDHADPSLYNETETFIASWNGTTNTVAHMNPHYSGKIYMDKKRRIWILGVERDDAGKYSVKFGADHGRLEVDIILTVKDTLTEEQLQECPGFPKEGSRNIIFGLLIVIMILVIAIFVIVIIIIVLMYKKRCSQPNQSSRSHDYTAVTTEGSGSHDSIFRLLITIMILVIIILVILIIIIVLMYKKLCSQPKQSFQSHEYTGIPTIGSEHPN